jgi:uncharacterized protein YdhG (YjbR/CyaY superfamily)
MSAREIDRYIAALPSPQRETIETVRARMLRIAPRAKQVISYGLPALELDGEIIGGFAAGKRHCSYYPFSGSVLPALAAELRGYSQTKGALHFSHETPLTAGLLRTLIAERRRQLRGR